MMFVVQKIIFLKRLKCIVQWQKKKKPICEDENFPFYLCIPHIHCAKVKAVLLFSYPKYMGFWVFIFHLESIKPSINSHSFSPVSLIYFFLGNPCDDLLNTIGRKRIFSISVVGIVGSLLDQ